MNFVPDSLEQLLLLNFLDLLESLFVSVTSLHFQNDDSEEVVPGVADMVIPHPFLL